MSLSCRLSFAWHAQGAAAAILGSVELPVAVILTSVVVHEHVLWTGWVGIALITIGIAVGQRRTSVTP